MELITIPKGEYLRLKEKAEVDGELLIKLIRGLEDVMAGRVKSWNDLEC